METSPVPTSPVIKKMDFPDAMREVMNGKTVRREEWPAGEYGLLQDGFLMIIKDGIHRWIVSDGDFEGKDWLIV